MNEDVNAFSRLVRNNNVCWGINKYGAYVNVCSYDMVLLDNITKVKSIFKDIVLAKEWIKKDLKCTKFTISIDCFFIDGLIESNSDLIQLQSSINY